MFGSMPFEFDNGLTLDYQLGRSDKQKESWERLKDVHAAMYKSNKKAKERWMRNYNQGLKEIEYKEGDRVYVYDGVVQMQEGRTLRTPWRGPYVVDKRLSSTGVMLSTEVRGANHIVRCHVNRLRPLGYEAIESREPAEGMNPDSRRLLRRIIGDEGRPGSKLYIVVRKCRKGYLLMTAEELPEIVVRAYLMSKLGRTARK